MQNDNVLRQGRVIKKRGLCSI